MPTFTAKPIQVQAVQIDASWFQVPEVYHRINEEQFMDVDRHFRVVRVWVSDHVKRGQEGDWVITYPDGSHDVIDGARFWGRYE